MAKDRCGIGGDLGGDVSERCPLGLLVSGLHGGRPSHRGMGRLPDRDFQLKAP